MSLARVSDGTITRRALLGLIGVGAGAVTGRLVWSRFFTPSARADRLYLAALEIDSTEGALYAAALTRSPQAVRMSSHFGRRYLEDRGGVDGETLAAEVMARLEVVRPWRAGISTAGRLDPEELGARLDEAIAADFLLEEGVHTIDDWYLSQTECRLAALRHIGVS